MANYDVFISHKSEDKQYLTQIEQFLDEKNYTYWSDSKMEQGITWTDQIHKAIKDSNVVIV